MKRWRGLFKKEWMLMKGWGYTSIIFIVLTAFVLPVAAAFYLGDFSKNLSYGFMVLSPFWLIVSLFFPAIILMVSLGREARRPDIWLHSPASVFELFGVKVLFAFIVGVLNYLISFILITMLFSFRVQPAQFVIENSTIQFIVLLLLGIFLASVMMICISLFFRVFHLVIRPHTKKFSTMITLLSFVIFVWLAGAVTSSSVYQKISRFGELGSISEKSYRNKEDFSFLIVNESTIYIGEIFLSITFAVFLFIAASILFERKVRL